MKEKGNLIFVIVAFVLGVLITSLCFIVFSKECEVCKECEKCETTKEDKLEVDEQKMFDLLHNISKKVYQKEEYLSLKKNDQGVYYATLEDLSKLNYDVSSLSHCEQDQQVIFFDIDNKLFDKYENEPIQISVTCVRGK
jgi:hypothetical protein